MTDTSKFRPSDPGSMLSLGQSNDQKRQHAESAKILRARPGYYGRRLMHIIGRKVAGIGRRIKPTETFRIERGVCHEHNISQKLLMALLKYACKPIDWKGMRINVDGKF